METTSSIGTAILGAGLLVLAANLLRSWMTSPAGVAEGAQEAS